MKRIAPVLVIVVLATAAFLVLRAVAKRDAESDMLGSGIIEADEVRVSPKLGGRLAEVLVAEGDAVEEGAMIARLEHADIDAEMARAEAAVHTAAAALRDLENGSRPEQIAAARSQLAEAAAARRGAEKQLATAREAYAKVTDLKQQVDTSRGKLRGAEAKVAQATAQLDEARRGPTEKDIDAVRAAVAQADARVAAARTALGNAEEVYAHQTAIETPVLLASTEASVLDLNSELAGRELDRAEQMAAGDALTDQALDQAQTQRAAAEARLGGARRTVDDAGTQVALTRAQAKQMRDGARTTLEEATKARDAAQAKLEVLLAGTREERVRLAEAALRAAEAEAETAQETLDNATQTHDDRLQARQQRDSAESTREMALARERAARAQLDLVLAGATEDAIDAARGRLREAEAALQAADVKRSYTEVVAPCAGTVTEVVADPGEVVGAGSSIVVVADLESMWLRAYVGFANLGEVTLGQKLSVSTQAVPDRVFEGEVIRVSDEAEFTPKDIQTPDQRMTQVYWVKVAVGEGGGALKPGMPADLTAGDSDRGQ